VEFRDYMNQFRKVAKLNEWSDFESAQQLGISMKGIAQRTVSDLSEKVQDDFEALVHALKQRFDPPERTIEYQREFWSKLRGSTQSVREYGDFVGRLTSNAFPDLSPAGYQDLAKQRFLYGLRDSDVQRQVRWLKPATLEQAISLASDYLGDVKPKDPTGRQPVRTLEVEGPVDTGVESETDLLKQQVEQLKEQLQKTPGPRQRRPWVPKEKVECWLCHKLGHFSFECPDNPNPGRRGKGNNTQPKELGLSPGSSTQSQ
jgi:hypothetical protein